MPKRGYSRSFTPKSETYGRYLLDKIPATLWREVRAKAKREGISVRALLLGFLRAWTSGNGETHSCAGSAEALTGAIEERHD